MHFCEQCARSVEPIEPNIPHPTCPRCGARLEADVAAGRANVARVTSLAEAGFLANDLAAEGIDAQVFESESFSVVSGHWSASYFIQVPSDQVQAAAALIRHHLADDAAGDAAGEDGSDWYDDPISPVLWRPVALIVLAGVVSFVVGQQWAGQRDERPPSRDSLSSAVGAIGEPLLTEPAAGMPRHRLFYHPRAQAWYLDTDSDGDGRFERRERFHTSGARW